MRNQTTPSTHQLTIVSAQINLWVGDIEGNADRIIAAAHRAAQPQAPDLILFPELAITSYPPEDLLFHTSLYTRVRAALNKIADHTKTLRLIVGYPEYSNKKRYNQLALLYQGTIVTCYAKRILPNYDVFDEQRYFSPGEQPCVIQINDVSIGLLICEDLWLETPIQSTIDAGAQLIVSINASPFSQDQSNARHHILQQHSRRYAVPIIYLNLIGGQDELVFDGGSMVFNHTGDLVQQAPYLQEALMTSTFNIDQTLHLIMPPAPQPPYSDTAMIYHTLVLGVHDYIKKNHFSGACLGLSGGIDSALMLAIAVDAIGADRITAIMMPSKFTSAMSLMDAEKIASTLAVNYLVIPIEPILSTFVNSLASMVTPQPAGTLKENLQARIRGTLLMALSNHHHSIVLNTSNKSEMAVGYTTLYGDMVGGFAALKDIPKTMVYDLARYRNTLSAVIPSRIIERAPSAELAHNQQDSDTLPPYSILDQMLEHIIIQRHSPDEMIEAGFDSKTVRPIVHRVNRSEYKRRQSPVGIRITPHAFGKDHRYPITSGFIQHHEQEDA